MPARSPRIVDTDAAKLATIGQRIRAHRKSLRVSASHAAEAAGMSRATLVRIERGEPSVTMGAYLNAIAALGLDLQLRPVMPSLAAAEAPANASLPHRIQVRDFAQLQQLAWQLGDAAELSPQEALAIYERNWRHVDVAALDARERALLTKLANTFSQGRLLV